jgi:hypothetical protein
MKNPMIVKDTKGRDVELKIGDRVRPAAPTKSVSYGYVRAITEHPNDPRSYAKTQATIYWPEIKQTGRGWVSIDLVAMPLKRKNPPRTSAPLPSDWPRKFVMIVKDEAATYASAIRGPWPDTAALQQRAIDRVVRKIEADTDTIDEAAESWVERWESGAIDAEIGSAVDYYGGQMLSALETNPARAENPGPRQARLGKRIARAGS